MSRILAVLLASLGLSLLGPVQVKAEGAEVKTDIPENIEACLTTSLTELFGINRSDRASLFNHLLNNIDAELFGRYNYKRAWVDWGDNSEIKRLAIYEYFQLMASRRGEHEGDTTSFDARLADRPLVKGENIYHIVASVNFEGGSSTTIVVFSSGCKAFGFMYGGANLRSFVDANLIERLYKDGKRAPF
ncbi:hypothetical protein [Actibacterium pelagium]|uniref:DUF4019 domain-containing protein n=1 Tax=Actibacterium pelagium TaxID=2029103 RepID=A0A917AA47_9RHOB|nr:hypothetical protein [Actibacterium pelagium]GGE37409.1 hypothetical protein GCM10011517_01430 [Actibacterium pelagium]